MSKAWRDRILRLTVCGIELCAFYTIITLINYEAVESPRDIFPILAIYLISLGFNRLFFNWKRGLYFTIVVNVLLWLVSTLAVIKLIQFPVLSLIDPAFLLAVPRAVAGYAAGFRPELIIFICSLFLWPFGYRLARARIGFVLSLAEFQCGLAVILFTYLIESQIGATNLNSIPVALIFTVFSILALALSHAEQQSSWLGGRHAVFWFSLLGLSIVLIIFLGFITGSFATHDFLDLLLTPVNWLWWLFTNIMLFLAAHIPLKQYFDPVDWGKTGGGGDQVTDIFQSLQMPLWLRDALRFIMGMVWVGLIIIVLWRVSSFIFQWLRNHYGSRYQADYESLDGAFKDDLWRFLRRIWDWFLRLLPRAKRKPASSEIESVRQIYREVLSWGASKGVRHLSEQTPYEYLFTLSEAIPLAADNLRVITDRYVDTRYGAISPGLEKLAELKTAWQFIKRNCGLHK